MAAARAAIWTHLAMGVSACAGAAHVCPTQFFYKSGARHTSMLTIWLAIGRVTPDTTTLVVGAAECLVQFNKEYY